MQDKPGFKAEEVPEYLGRKTLAIILVIIGILMSLGGFFIGIYEAGSAYKSGGDPWVAFIACIIFISIPGIIMACYGEHYWKKVTHIMWTRQALREYGVVSLKQLQTTALEIQNKEDIKKLIEILETRFIKGEVSEEVYKELKSKLENKLKSLDN